ncbi:MAG: hypothetical protein IIA66_12345 [Planctomycetes bacterium]|nr:hypothetical protein [Planctomycetota bacterium]
MTQAALELQTAADIARESGFTQRQVRYAIKMSAICPELMVGRIKLFEPCGINRIVAELLRGGRLRPSRERPKTGGNNAKRRKI